MSLTSIKSSQCRIEKDLQISTNPGRYHLNVPGPGTNVLYQENPFIRMQKWGANNMTNSVNLESDLKGLSRNINQDCLPFQYDKHAPSSQKKSFNSSLMMTEQSRSIMPAWTARDLEQTNWYILPLNPQENVCYPFENNLSTRILEKDYYNGTRPCVSNDKSFPLYTNNYVSPNNKGCSNIKSCTPI
jgi:hypothetical protein